MASLIEDLYLNLATTFITEHPRAAAVGLSKCEAQEVVEQLTRIDAVLAAHLLEDLEPGIAAEVICQLPDEPTQSILKHMSPANLARLLSWLDQDVRDQNLALLDDRLREELIAILTYPPDTAGSLMDARVTAFKPEQTVADVWAHLPTVRRQRIMDVVVTNEDGGLLGLIPLQTIFLADTETSLKSLITSVPPSIHVMGQREEIIELMTTRNLLTLPVVDLDARVLGVIRQNELIEAVQTDAGVDLQTMVGAGRDERALSPPMFSVKRRLPWLSINLVTAFLAAAVVGLFESTIAQFTALAVLLPVVAGQSGNTGAQALAVTMRGLALREVRTSQWMRLLAKEAVAGAVNGIGIAVLTAAGVAVWSQSPGLCLVIAVSMVVSMAIASVAGAAIPLILVLLKQDPATSSSIILTTVTDVFGFLSFLGLASLLSSML